MDEIVTALLPAIGEQLESPDTPYVKEAYDRLLADPDIKDEEAREMIAFCLADEIEKLDRDGREFDPARYQMLLNLLPALPESR
ncbi:hypothetical protein N9Z15_01225 [Akkermansiaceae bacterium]|nr:hypothetical protein [Akkermansiaceae bacterium]MDB4412669.1 hypothetical protein [bacterium]